MDSVDIGPWWRGPFEVTEQYSLEDVLGAWSQVALVRRALDHGLRAHAIERRGAFGPGRDVLLASIEALGGRLLTGGPPREDDGSLHRGYVFADGFLRVDYARTGEATLHCLTTDERLAVEVRAICDGFDRDLERGLVHVVTKGHCGFTLRVATRAGLPIERDNYAPEVLTAYDRVVADLGEPSPAGRLVLLEGPPGTGKTHLVRGLIEAVSPATFVLLPAEMVESIDRPELMLDAAESRDTRGPLIFVIEDADGCLVPRANDNMSAIRSLLNCTDGILGSAFDLRIIATTNARRFEIEPALLRAGRLSERISVDTLSRAQASRILARLTGETAPLAREPMVLADVYSEARRLTRRVEPVPRRVDFPA